MQSSAAIADSRAELVSPAELLLLLYSATRDPSSVAAVHDRRDAAKMLQAFRAEVRAHGSPATFAGCASRPGCRGQTSLPAYAYGFCDTAIRRRLF